MTLHMKVNEKRNMIRIVKENGDEIFDLTSTEVEDFVESEILNSIFDVDGMEFYLKEMRYIHKNDELKLWRR